MDCIVVKPFASVVKGELSKGQKVTFVDEMAEKLIATGHLEKIKPLEVVKEVEKEEKPKSKKKSKKAD